MQWCFPFRRQQAGKLDSSRDDAAKSGAARGSPMMASNRIVRNRLNTFD
jgi:hypothetical protein